MQTLTANPMKNSRGFTLVELMIGITLALFVIGGLILLFITSSDSSREITESNRQIEDGQYALKSLVWELDHAGYLSYFNPRELATPAAVPDPCDTSDTDLAAALPIHIQGYDDGTSPDCLDPTARKDSDVVVIRRASVCDSTSADCLAAGGPFIQVSSCQAQGFTELSTGIPKNYFKVGYDAGNAAMNLHTRKCIAAQYAPVRRYVVRIYYVGDYEYYPGEPKLPTLMRAELNPGGGFTSVPIAPNVESLQFEYGIDTDGDGVTDVFSADPTLAVDPDTGAVCDAGTAQCAEMWRDTVAVKAYLLARNKKSLKGPSVAKTFALGLQADGKNEFLVNTAADGYKRSVYQTVARLNNPSMRRER